MRSILFFTILLPTLVYADTIIFSCNTEKHTINIYKNSDQKTYTYKSWNKPKEISEKPDMELISSSYEKVAGSNYFKFKTGKTEFEVTDQWLHLSKGEVPPESASNASGDLYVRVNGNLKSHYYCKK
jgi:hypothetical protein